MAFVKQILVSLWEVLEVVVIAVLTVFVIRTFLIQPFLVSGASMEPNVQQNNYLIIDELTYHFREPQRGEVVVFRYPGDPSTFYIKRIMGLPGETVSFAGGKVLVDGEVVDESGYLRGADTQGAVRVTLAPGTYFVMGDNRANSYDSRAWGPLDRRLIVGKALIRLYPFDHITVFADPQYQ